VETTATKEEGPKAEGEREKAPRRQQWSEAKARRVLAELAASGEPTAHFAKKLGVYPSRLYRWMKRLGQRKQKAGPRRATRIPQFVPLRVVEPARATAAEQGFELRAGHTHVGVEVCGHLVRVERGFDPGVLRAVVAALEGREARSC